MKPLIAGMLVAGTIAIIGVPLAAKAYEDYRIYRIDANPAVPDRAELLRPSYVDGLSHGHIALMRQYNRLYPGLRIDITGGPTRIKVANSDNPQVLLSATECMVEQRLGRRAGQRCIAY